MKIKLIYPPRYHPEIEGKHPEITLAPLLSRIPMISLPYLTSSLRNLGFKVDQDDLDIKVYFFNGSRKDALERINMKPFLDQQRVKRFLDSGRDTELEDEGYKILNLTKYKGYDFIGFSLGDEWNFSAQSSIMILSHLLKRETDSYLTAGGSDIGCILQNFSKKTLMRNLDGIFLSHHFPFAKEFVALVHAIDSKERVRINRTARNTFTDHYSREVPKVLLNSRLQHLESLILSSQEPRRNMDWATEPIPDFDGLPLELYTYLPKDIKSNFNVKSGILVLPYRFSIGCPNKCIFCACSSAESRFFTKKAETIIQELETMSKRYHTRYFMFLNTNINPTKTFARRLVQFLNDADLNLMLSDCANFRHLDRKLLDSLFEVGVRRLIYGIESPTDSMLKYVDKGITEKQIKRWLIHSDRIGIWNEVEVIAGLPYENQQIIERTKRFIIENKKYIDFFHLHKFKLLNSKLTDTPEKYGITNIRETNEKGVQGKAFDEINGLRWNEKLKQINESYEEIRITLHSLPYTGYNDKEESFIRLLHLYTILADKKSVREYIRQHPYQR